MEPRELIRHLKPLKESKYSDFEVLQAMIKADIDPEEIASVTQLRGTSDRGVIRVAMRTQNSANKLDELVRKRRLCIGQVALAEVREGGHFIKVLLENVPLYISDSDVEEEMSKYGSVASSDKEYLDFEGCRIANERRTVLFSSIHLGSSSLDKKRLTIKGNPVYSTVIQGPPRKRSSDPGKEKILDEIVRKLAACQRRSYIESQSDGDDLQLEPELLEYLRRRSSLKVRGEKKSTPTTMSSVAYRQSTVIRDVEREKRSDAYGIFTSKDLVVVASGKDRAVARSSQESKDRERSADKGETAHKISWLKKFGGHKPSKLLCKNSKSSEKISYTRDGNLKINTTGDYQSSEKAEPHSRTSMKQAKGGQKVKCCNETFNSFLDIRKKQKRNEAFLQLSANLL